MDLETNQEGTSIVAEPNKNSEGVKVQNFPTGGGNALYPDIFIAFFN